MGVYTQREVEGLLRENLKLFCQKNFTFDREIKVNACVSFSLDDNDAFICNVNDNFLPTKSTATVPVVTRRRGRRKRVVPVRGVRRKQENANCSTSPARTDVPSAVTVKTEPSYSDPSLEAIPGEDAIAAGRLDFPVSCPLVASAATKEEMTLTENQDDSGDADFDDETEVEQDDTEPETRTRREKRGTAKRQLSFDTDKDQADSDDETSDKQSPNKHACTFCGKVYPKPNRLIVHERTHTGERPYSCPKCNKSYRSPASLKIHRKKGCVDRRRKGAREMLAKQAEEPPEELDDDDDPPQEAKRRDCRFCGRVFSKPSRLTSHERTHTGERPFTCSKCGKAYVSLQGLRTHQIRGCLDRRKKQAREGQEKKPPPQHACQYCGKVYAKRNRMLVHERTQHTGERPFLCATCGKSYASKMTLNQHTLIHTKDKNYICSVCDARFLLPYTLKVHMRVHTGERPHVCWHCGRAFRQYGSFQVHLRTHTKEKPLKCSKCEQRFAHRSLLLKHEMMHEGERKFNCTQCEKRFWTAHELKTHQRTHLGIRRHVCPQCGMRFTQVSSLKRHVEGHSGSNKNHACPICGKTFTRAHQVTIHMKVHLPDSPYRCQTCRTNFKSMASRRVHMEAHHPEQAFTMTNDSQTSTTSLATSNTGTSGAASTGAGTSALGPGRNPQPPSATSQHEGHPFIIDPAPQTSVAPHLPPHNLHFTHQIGPLSQGISQAIHHVPEPSMYHHNM